MKVDLMFLVLADESHLMFCFNIPFRWSRFNVFNFLYFRQMKFDLNITNKRSLLNVLSRQMKVVTDGVEIIIATPGRLNDLVEAGCIHIESVTYLVLDEVPVIQLDKIMFESLRIRLFRTFTLNWCKFKPPQFRKMQHWCMRSPSTFTHMQLTSISLYFKRSEEILIASIPHEKQILYILFKFLILKLVWDIYGLRPVCNWGF